MHTRRRVVSCGYKWLCGPYGTGFTSLHPYLLARLRPHPAYWLAMQAGRGLDQMRGYTLPDDLGVRAFDVFCPANFLDVLPWIAAVELTLQRALARSPLTTSGSSTRSSPASTSTATD